MDVILIIILAIVLSAFFSGMEIAFIASNKLRIELDRKQGVNGSKIIKFFAGNPGQYIATMLIGNNIALVIYGLFFSKLLNPILTPILGSDVFVLIINTLISTSLILTIAEFIPKTIFIISPARPARVTAERAAAAAPGTASRPRRRRAQAARSWRPRRRREPACCSRSW
jgi:CBS domain containing-hemolysin-like protein